MPFFTYVVSGEANFTMDYTGMVVGGFMQPNVARELIEPITNTEKGVHQRFLWILPKPSLKNFAI